MVSSDETGVILTLGIDTAGPATSVALVQGEQCLAAFSLWQPATVSRPLLRLIDLVCMQTGCKLADVAALAVNIGPGAFTGVRVGLATAQGLAFAYDKPIIGCSAFDALVSLAPHWQGALCPVIQARQGEVYAAFYRRQGNVVRETAPGMVVTPAALSALVTEPTLFMGSGVRAHGAGLVGALGARAVCIDTTDAETGLAVRVAHVGHVRLQTVGPEALPVPQPLYVRPADARLPLIAANAASRGS